MAFYIGVYAYAIIVQTKADQLLPKLLMEQFDTCLYNVDTLNIWMKEFGLKNIFWQNDSYENFSLIIIFPNYSLIGLLYMRR